MSTSHPSHGPENLMKMMQGAQVTAFVTAAVDLGVFAAVAKGARTAQQIAEGIKAPVRSTEVLLDGLAVVGLLAKKAGSYENTPLSDEHLVPGKPMYMGDMTGIFGSPMMWTGYQHLTEAIRNDGTVLPEHAETPKHPFWEAFARSSASMAFPTAQTIIGMLSDWIAKKPTLRALDIAAGSGIYGLSLAKLPNVDVTLLDWPNVLVESKKWAERLGSDPSRVHYIEGNLFEVDYRGPYDLAVLSQIYHHFDDATCLSLTKKVAAALAPGGRLAINDFIYDESLANPMAAMFRTTMLMWTRKGTTYTEADVRRWLGEAGLAVVEVKANAGMPSSIVVAEKRA
jgi:2-polyprenyl-3-methyl-5-hydroxy-6-metoxy-1,4-benzoquinol methylase